MLCRDVDFWKFLFEDGQLFEQNEAACIDWIQSYLGIGSRSELKTNLAAQAEFKNLYSQYKEWKNG